jgi:hypothetical protein
MEAERQELTGSIARCYLVGDPARRIEQLR